jgi:hypothetical protein
MKQMSPGWLGSTLIICFALFLTTNLVHAQTEPKIEGSPYKEIDYEALAKTVSKKDKERLAKENKKGKAPIINPKAPKTRTRAGDLIKGGRTIYQFTNHDFPATGNTCGQAAVATAVWNRGVTLNHDAAGFARDLYRFAPPKITIPFVGSNTIGTDWHQVNHALNGYKKHGIQYGWYKGRALLDKYIDMGLPCIIMLDMGVFGAHLWGSGHWVVAFGRNSLGYYVTNWDSKWNGRHYFIPWDELNRAWGGGGWNEGQMAKAHGTAEMFCVVWK